VFDRNTLVDAIGILNQSDDPTLEKMNYPQVQNGDIQGTDDDNHQTHKTHHFHNCGMVYLDSLNTRRLSVTMEDCGNHVQQVTHRRPRVIDHEQNNNSQSHAALDGPKTLTGPPANPRICDISPPPPISGPFPHAPSKSEIMGNPCDVCLQKNTLSPPEQPLRSISPSHLSGDHTYHDLKYLEQLLESSLATVAVIQFSGNTLADVLTPRAYDTLKALYALAALDVSLSSTQSKVGGIPTHSDFSDIRNAYPYLSNPNQSPSPPNPRIAIPRTCRIHISISVDYVVLFSWASFVAVSCLAFFVIVPQVCGIEERV